MKEQKFVECFNSRDGKTYLVTEQEDRIIKLFSMRFVFVLLFALVLNLTNYFELIHIVILAGILIVLLELLNYRFRVKLFSDRFPVEPLQVLSTNKKYNTSRSMLYFIFGGSIIAYTVNKYGTIFDVKTIIMYFIGASFIYKSYILKNK